jgi:B12-binding domain/radical SAM domain protein
VLRDPDGGPPDLDRYPPFAGPRFGPVEVTRGCPYRCGFCAVGGRSVRHRSADGILAAAERLRASGRRRVVFVTPDALSYGGSLGELEALLAGLRRVGARPSAGSFPSEVRPDRVTPEAVEILARYCENRTLVMGAQSGDDAVLRRLGRGHTVEDVLRAARVARRGGFTPHVDLIFGLPEETPEEQRATVELARTLRREVDARLHVHYFHPLPGTPFWGRDPSPLSGEARAFLGDVRASGAEDGCWPEQERWAWQLVEWSRQGLIRVPRGAARSDGSDEPAFSPPRRREPSGRPRETDPDGRACGRRC